MNTLLIEIAVAELPTKAIENVSLDLLEKMELELNENNIFFSQIKRFATARRLAIQVEGIAEKQQDQEIEKRGPSLKSARNNDGSWSRAASGFAASCGVKPDELSVRKTDKGEWLFFEGIKAGKQTTKLIPELFKKVIDNLFVTKRMRWGDREDSFIRPVLSLVMLINEDIINTNILGVNSGRETIGHRFHGEKTLVIPSAKDYEYVLANSFVIADIKKRRDIIVEQVKKVTKCICQGKAVAYINEDTLDEVNALVEYPVAILGEFNPRYLNIPQEVLIKTMQDNQKYFAVFNDKNEILPYFITVANIESKSPEIVKTGNQRVIEPRFADAEFFWKNDIQKTLISRRDELKKVIYQQKLGSIYDRSDRIAKIAIFIAKKSGFDIDDAKRGSELSKCDLVTEMVFEFGELQGIIGEYYAKNDGEKDNVAASIREHYLPKFAGDGLPQTDTGLAVALADKLESVIGGFSVGAKPTGTKDPYALRRACLGIIRLLNETKLDLSLMDLLSFSTEVFDKSLEPDNRITEITNYINERLKGYYQEKDIRHDVFEAVLAVKPLTIKDFSARVNSLTAFMQHKSAVNLFAANKRISNILKKYINVGLIDTSLLIQKEEISVYEKSVQVKEKIKKTISNADYQKSLDILATLRGTLDDFFEHVIVMSEDEKIKNNRLALLTEIRQLFLQMADFSKVDYSDLN